jgi:hypothetical protein
MRVVNRTAVTITGNRSSTDARHSADFNRGAVPWRAKAHGSAFLLPEFDLGEDLQEWVEENAAWLFDFSSPGRRGETWPQNRDLDVPR